MKIKAIKDMPRISKGEIYELNEFPYPYSYELIKDGWFEEVKENELEEKIIKLFKPIEKILDRENEINAEINKIDNAYREYYREHYKEKIGEAIKEYDKTYKNQKDRKTQRAYIMSMFD